MLVMIFALSQAKGNIKEISHFPKSRLVAEGGAGPVLPPILAIVPRNGVAALVGDIWTVVNGGSGPWLSASVPGATHQLPGL